MTHESDKSSVTLPTGAPESPTKNKMITQMDLVERNYIEGSNWCAVCPYLICEPDINFYGCKILMGDIDIAHAPCL